MVLLNGMVRIIESQDLDHLVLLASRSWTIFCPNGVSFKMLDDSGLEAHWAVRHQIFLVEFFHLGGYGI